jgi:hypothetical protein
MYGSSWTILFDLDLISNALLHQARRRRGKLEDEQEARRRAQIAVDAAVLPNDRDRPVLEERELHLIFRARRTWLCVNCGRLDYYMHQLMQIIGSWYTAATITNMNGIFSYASALEHNHRPLEHGQGDRHDKHVLSGPRHSTTTSAAGMPPPSTDLNWMRSTRPT